MKTAVQKVIKARKVVCLDQASTTAEWIAIAGGRIAAIGMGDPPAAGQTVVTEGVVLPGMIDSHVHLTATGLFGSGLDLREARSVKLALDQVRKFMQGSTPKWVVAGNFDPGRNADARMPNRYELDRVSAGRFLLLSRADGHSCTVNSATLEALHLDPDLPGIEMDSENFPSGVLANRARYEAGSRFLSNLPDAEIRSAHEAACRIAVKRGVTAVHEMSQHRRDFDILLQSKAGYPINIRPYFSTFDVSVVMAARLDCIGGDLFLDGSLGSHTAALSAPYADEPGSQGSLYHSDQEIADWLIESSRAGLQTAVHAIGDAAIEQALACLEEAFVRLEPEGALGAHRLRHRIEHFELVTADQIDRARRLGVVPSVQPMFDRYWGGGDGMYAQRLGKRAQTMNPFSRLIASGMNPAGGSDSTVTPLDPLLGIAAAAGHHIGEHAVSVEEALRMFTIWAAHSAHDEFERGSIEAGKRADFCIVSEDPLQLEPDQIPAIEVLETWVGGERAFPT